MLPYITSFGHEAREDVGIDGICASCPICVAEPYHCIIQQLLVRPMFV
jgi:hypothetical protein